MKCTITVALLALALAGCGGGDKPAAAGGSGKPAAPAAGGGGGGAPAAAGGKYDAAKSTASVKFAVKWSGAAVAPVMNAPGDEYCAKAHNGTGFANERYVVNADGTIPHTFIVATEGPHKGMTDFPAPAPFVLNQVGCKYEPHVFGVRTGQMFTIKNSDGTTHNVKSAPKANKPFNHSQAPQAQNEESFSVKENGIAIGCDVHSWMSAVAFSVDHPFFATTGADGTATISGLPAGKYKFKVWHEGFTADKPSVSADVEIEVKDGEAKAQAVELK